MYLLREYKFQYFWLWLWYGNISMSIVPTFKWIFLKLALFYLKKKCYKNKNLHRISFVSNLKKERKQALTRSSDFTDSEFQFIIIVSAQKMIGKLVKVCKFWKCKNFDRNLQYDSNGSIFTLITSLYWIITTLLTVGF